MKRGFAVLLVLLLTAALFTPVLAEEAPTPASAGSIRLTLLTADQKPVAGGTLMLYAVALLDKEGNYTPTEEFSAFRAQIAAWDEQDAALADLLWEHVLSNSILGKVSRLSADGKASWGGLADGLYLIGQTGAGPNGELCNSFLVTVPYWDGLRWLREVDASPKCGTAATPKPPKDHDTPPKTPTIPQTGQLWWPVPVLLGGGACLILIGILLLTRRRKGSAPARTGL